MQHTYRPGMREGSDARGQRRENQSVKRRSIVQTSWFCRKSASLLKSRARVATISYPAVVGIDAENL